GKRGAREKDKWKPEELVDDLSFLHGVGDAGNDQTQGSEGRHTDGDQHKGRKEITEMSHMKDKAGEKELEEDRGPHEHVTGDDAGSQHVACSNWSDVETAEDALLAKRYESGAQSPKASHHRKAQNRGEEESDASGKASGKDSSIEKEKGKRHEHREEQEHFIAQ